MTSPPLSAGRLILAQAQANADEAEANLHVQGAGAGELSTWQVQARVLRGRAAEAIIRRAESVGLTSLWSARKTLRSGATLLGSVSKKVVTESRCSVRVARRGFEKDDGAPYEHRGRDVSPALSEHPRCRQACLVGQHRGAPRDR